MITWLFLALLTVWSAEPAVGELILEIDNVREAQGKIWVGIYDSPDNFLVQEKALVLDTEIYRTGSTKLRLPSLPYGSYAIALFHDLNGNNHLDRNWLGIPTEPYAFSGMPRSKWRLPRFEEVRFQFQRHQQRLRVHLDDW